MSQFLTDFSNVISHESEENALRFGVEYFSHCHQPWNELLRYLTILTSSHNKNIRLIQCLIDSFGQWKNQFGSKYFPSMFDENLFLHLLPITVLKDYCRLFEVAPEYLFHLLQEIHRYSLQSPTFKRLLTIIATFDLQLEFSPRDLLLPLILNIKYPLIHIYLDKKAAIQEYLLDLLNHLYEDGGQRFRWILQHEFNIREQNLNKKAIRKLAIRFWNQFGDNRIDHYPNLACLQDRSSLGYLFGVKYNNTIDERSMSDEAWNEAIDELIRDNQELIKYFLELLIDNRDVDAAKFWIHQLNISNEILPQSVKNALRSRNFPQRPIEKKSTKSIHYRIPMDKIRIHFVETTPDYNILLQRLMRSDENILIGFDCEWKPIFKNSSTAKQRISIMQIAFPDEIFLLDLLYFFHTCDQQLIQQPLANRLFDDDRVTVLCYGFQADFSMLTSSYPIFTSALQSGKTLLDICLVQSELKEKQSNIFPFSLDDPKSPLKEKGLSELSRLCFGYGLDKSEQCSNWERRPLRNAQINYAATDAFCLLDVYRFFIDNLNISEEYLQSFRGRKSTKKKGDEDSSLEILQEQEEK